MRETEGSPRLALVEYLRGMAALSVAWFHLTNQYEWGPVRLSGSWGWLGVAVFFVISGYVLPLSISGRTGSAYGVREFGWFAKRRILRIEPPYLISVLLTILLWYASALAPGFQGTTPAFSFGTVLSHVAYLPSILGYEWIQPVYWTLGYEFCFYGVLGLCYPALLRHPAMTIIAVVAVAMAGSFALHGGALDPYIPLFALGAVVFLVQRALLQGWQFWLFVGAAGALSAAADWRIGCAGLATALVLLIGREWRMPGRFHEAGLFLGLISYSLYITHVPIGGRVVNLGRRFFHTEFGQLATSLVALGVSLLFALAFWYVVERYFIALSRRRPAPPAGAAVSA